MTIALAIAPVLLTPVVAWLLMEYGPERSVVFAAYWLVLSVVFAIAMPVFRRRGRSLAFSSVCGALVAMLATVIIFSVLLFGFTPRARAATNTVSRNEIAVQPGSRADTVVRTPAAGSSTRTAILDAVRAKVGVRSRFKVSHIRANDRWAFVRCVEVVDDGDSLQETDLDIAALLERRRGTNGEAWQVVELWALSTDQERPYSAFAKRLRQRVRTARISTALFPTGFLDSDVPTD